MKTDFRSAGYEYVKLEKEGCKIHMIFRGTGTEGEETCPWRRKASGL